MIRTAVPVSGAVVGGVLSWAVLCFGAGCDCKRVEVDAPISKGADKMDETRGVFGDVEPPFRLTVTPEGVQRRNRVCVKLEVKNVSGKVIGWDREFAVFIACRLHADDDEHYLGVTHVGARMERTPESLSKKGFVSIEPGKSFTKVRDLTEPFRSFRYEGSGPAGAALRDAAFFEGYEQMVRFVVPRRVRKLDIQCHYLGTPSFFAAFRDLFGFEPSEVNLCEGPWESDKVTIDFSE
jgi:hypothetical protein